MTTIISQDNHWMLIMIMFLSTGVAICLEQRYKWAAKISGAIIKGLIQSAEFKFDGKNILILKVK